MIDTKDQEEYCIWKQSSVFPNTWAITCSIEVTEDYINSRSATFLNPESRPTVCHHCGRKIKWEEKV